MGKQYNKVKKRNRRKNYLARRKMKVREQLKKKNYSKSKSLKR